MGLHSEILSPSELLTRDCLNKNCQKGLTMRCTNQLDATLCDCTRCNSLCLRADLVDDNNLLNGQRCQGCVLFPTMTWSQDVDAPPKG